MQLEYLQQPIVCTRTMQMAGVELLARFANGPPPVTLDGNVWDWLMMDIGGLARIRYSRPAPTPYLVFVNLSRYIATSPWALEVFLTVCRRTMERAGVQVVVEIDEELILEDPDLVLLIRRVRAFGLRIAMDDHRGKSGDFQRSRLNCWDIVKVCAQRRPIEQVCENIKELAANGTPVVAEAIETKEALAMVCSAGAAYVQGWETGRPSPELLLIREEKGPKILAIDVEPLRPALHAGNA